MGASNSHGDSNSYPRIDAGQGKKNQYHKGTYVHSEYIVKPGKKGGSSKGKPSPVSLLQVQDVSHNSLTLTWLPPRHHCGSTILAYTVEMTTPAKSKDKRWVTLTQTCQGTSYQVKNLTPNAEYIFRVRAENLNGVSKPGRPSDIIQTKMYELEEKIYNHQSHEDKPKTAPTRRHSFNLHLESTVSTILNHTDIDVKPRTATTSETGRESSRISTLQRDASARSSLQPNRKRSLPILLPGTKTNSMLKLRDSQTLPNIKSAADGSGFHTEQSMKDGAACSESLSRRTGSRMKNGARSDDDGKLKDTNSKRHGQESNTDDDLNDSSQEQGSDEGLDSDPWEKDESVSGVSERILSASLCDDAKIALYTRSVPEDAPGTGTTWGGRCIRDEVVGEVQADFRTLRSLLHSDDIIVKPTRSLPDVSCSSGVKKLSLHRNNNNNNNYGQLSTIVDLEEDEVLVTTL